MEDKGKRIEELERENAYLKRLLKANNIAYEEACPSPVKIISFSSNLEKVSLFRDYFRGREDVYAQTRLTKEGKKAIYPACKYRANGRYCEYFGEHGCKGCQRKENDPLTDEVVLRHLLGKETIGVYPLLYDNTCFFLAIDFDGEGFK